MTEEQPIFWAWSHNGPAVQLQADSHEHAAKLYAGRYPTGRSVCVVPFRTPRLFHVDLSVSAA